MGKDATMIPFCISTTAFATTTFAAGPCLIARDWRAGAAYTATALASLAGVFLTMGGFAI